jgi:hypothetical protein
MCAASISEEELKDFHPHLVFVDDENRIVKPNVGDRHWNLDGFDTLTAESEMNEALREMSEA